MMVEPLRFLQCSENHRRIRNPEFKKSAEKKEGGKESSGEKAGEGTPGEIQRIQD